MLKTAEHLHITSHYSHILARELSLQERDLPRLLQGTNLPHTVLLPGDETRLSGPQQLRIIQNARYFDNGPDLGLRVGSQLHPNAHGPIGDLAQSSSNLLAALQSLRDFLPLRIGITQLELEESGSWLRCRLNIRIAAPAAEKRMLLECSALLLQNLIEYIIGKPLDDARIEFEFNPPGYRKLYADYFHSSVRFSKESSQLLLPTSLLQTPNTTGDPGAYALSRDLCERLLVQLPPAALSMTDRVRRRLLSMPLQSASEEGVARALFVSKRTLARRLGQEGTGYREIRDRLFSELAARHLRERELSVEVIAALLGYHDSANFRRAFRRWRGLSPQQFRQS